MKIFELLDTKVQYEVVRHSANSFWTRAEIGGREIEFRAVKNDGYDGWEIMFAERIPASVAKGAPHNMTYAATGKGHALAVGAMIVDSLKEFINTYKPQSIDFTAEKSEPAREKIYSRAMAKFFPEFKRDDSADSADSDESQMRYIRKDLSESIHIAVADTKVDGRHSNHPPARAGFGGPKHSFVELADEFGLSNMGLMGLMKKFPGFPTASLKAGANVASSPRTYYDVAQARKWFKSTKVSK